jgi:hypothetical protein
LSDKPEWACEGCWSEGVQARQLTPLGQGGRTVTGAGNPGDDDFTLIGVSNFSGTKGELRESYSGGNTIVSGDVNGDGHADFSFALKGHFLLTGVGDLVL